ncbi:GntR family transcriptional regulator [Bacillus freudenreichii]|nr:GntR family transcriptional regulator [Bacillus freudenreichii]
MAYKDRDWIGKFEVYSITEQIADHLKQTIIYGDFNEGEKLPSETEMADMFGVSRQTVRDALRSLSSIKLITTKPGRSGGHYISTVTEEHIKNSHNDHFALSLTLDGVTLREIIEMRKIIEVKACYLSAINRTEDDLLQMKKKIDFLKSEKLSDLLFYKNDYNFHKCVAEATKNKLIVLSLEAISHTLAPLFKYIECPSQLKKQLIHEMESIYTSIYNKEADKAARKMSDHLQHFENFFKEETFSQT